MQLGNTQPGQEPEQDGNNPAEEQAEEAVINPPEVDSGIASCNPSPPRPASPPPRLANIPEEVQGNNGTADTKEEQGVTGPVKPELRRVARARSRFRLDRSKSSFERKPTMSSGDKTTIRKRKRDAGEIVRRPSSSPAALESRRRAPPTEDGDGAVPGPSGMPAVVRLSLGKSSSSESD